MEIYLKIQVRYCI